ncbi:hypothetical protein C7212DRAFT_347585 [Tuber magnatum]|uniref:Uncharacterized protein n=1 Tax=Tuber magnatum TaxID=42249 RepID=A0A317SJ17_9PEZI|nr:hypothetical protein C7212DRAFT_347585 [Tuber magnatum]
MWNRYITTGVTLLLATTTNGPPVAGDTRLVMGGHHKTGLGKRAEPGVPQTQPGQGAPPPALQPTATAPPVPPPGVTTRPGAPRTGAGGQHSPMGNGAVGQPPLRPIRGSTKAIGPKLKEEDGSPELLYELAGDYVGDKAETVGVSGSSTAGSATTSAPPHRAQWRITGNQSRSRSGDHSFTIPHFGPLSSLCTRAPGPVVMANENIRTTTSSSARRHPLGYENVGFTPEKPAAIGQADIMPATSSSCDYTYTPPPNTVIQAPNTALLYESSGDGKDPVAPVVADDSRTHQRNPRALPGTPHPATPGSANQPGLLYEYAGNGDPGAIGVQSTTTSFVTSYTTVPTSTATIQTTRLTLQKLGTGRHRHRGHILFSVSDINKHFN